MRTGLPTGAHREHSTCVDKPHPHTVRLRDHMQYSSIVPGTSDDKTSNSRDSACRQPTWSDSSKDHSAASSSSKTRSSLGTGRQTGVLAVEPRQPPSEERREPLHKDVSNSTASDAAMQPTRTTHTTQAAPASIAQHPIQVGCIALWRTRPLPAKPATQKRHAAAHLPGAAKRTATDVIPDQSTPKYKGLSHLQRRQKATVVQVSTG